MAEEKKPAPRTGSERNRKFLVFYVVTLFLAAAVLILLSYLVEARNANQSLTASNQEQQGTVQSALEKVQQIQQENQQLQQRSAQLESQLQETRSQRNRAQQSLSTRERALRQARQSLDRQQQALTRFWWLERCWSRGSRSDAREILDEMERAGDRALLPGENPLDPAAESPQARYDTIYENLR